MKSLINQGGRMASRMLRARAMLALALLLTAGLGRAGELLVNGGFEDGFTGWTATDTGSPAVIPTWLTGGPGAGDEYFTADPQEGSSFAYNDFDGSAPKSFNLFQEVTIPPTALRAILRWTDRIQWNMFIGSLDRVLTVEVQPSGGGAPLVGLHTETLIHVTTGDTGYVVHEFDLLALAPNLAGQTVRLNWHEDVPEAATGPALYALDAVSLEIQDGCPLAAAPTGPSPANLAANVDPAAILSWSQPAETGGPGTVVVPNANAAVEGSTSNYSPLNLSPATSARYQQAYTAAAVGRSGLITAIRFRPDSGFGAPFGPNDFNGEVRLGYCAVPVNAISAVFADNIVPGSETLVFSGTAGISSANTGASPRDFDIVLPLQQPFFYDPAQGPLLLDLRLLADPGATALDADLSPEISRAFTNPFAGQDVTSPEGGIDIGYGVVTQFSFEGDSGPRPALRIGVVHNTGSSNFQDNLPIGLARSSEIGLTPTAIEWSVLLATSGGNLRSQFDIIYVTGDPLVPDYDSLRAGVAGGGPLEQFAAAGGVLALVVSGNYGNQADVGPGGADYLFGGHQTESFTRPNHPFLTGELLGGTPLTPDNFNEWNATDHGVLVGLPAGAREILNNGEGTSLAEYRHGSGTVIMTTLTAGWNFDFPGSPYIGPAFTNFLRLAALRARPARIGVINHTGEISDGTAMTKLALLPGVIGEVIDWATISGNPGSALRARFDAIYDPASLFTLADQAALVAAVAPGGGLDQFALLGGAVIETIPFYDNTANIAPGGVDFVNNYQDSATFASAANAYITGAHYGGNVLTEAQFVNWSSTSHGLVTGFPATTGRAILRNPSGITLAEYHWGAGTVILDTTTNGVDIVYGAEHQAEPFENLLLFGGYRGQYGPCPEKPVFDIYLDAATTPPTTLIAEGLTGTSLDPSDFAAATRYYWQVAARTEDGESRSSVWTFTTTGWSGRSLGDLDSSGCTEINDFLFLLDYWLVVSPIGGDPIGIDDFLTLLDYWNTGPGC